MRRRGDTACVYGLLFARKSNKRQVWRGCNSLVQTYSKARITQTTPPPPLSCRSYQDDVAACLTSAAGEALVSCSKVFALLNDLKSVRPQYIRRFAHAVLAHRMGVSLAECFVVFSSFP